MHSGCSGLQPMNNSLKTSWINFSWKRALQSKKMLHILWSFVCQGSFLLPGYTFMTYALTCTLTRWLWISEFHIAHYHCLFFFNLCKQLYFKEFVWVNVLLVHILLFAKLVNAICIFCCCGVFYLIDPWFDVFFIHVQNLVLMPCIITSLGFIVTVTYKLLGFLTLM